MVRFEPWQLLLLLFPVLIIFHLFVAPYTKVEESFNLQATHDVLAYGIPTSNVNLKFKALFDHMEFSGAVPRTFVGSVLLAGVAQPILWLSTFCTPQSLVRAVLGLFNAWALIIYTLGVRSAFGTTAAIWYIALQASQFHIIFYASRTLPNMFAFGLSTLALRFLLPDSTMLNRVRRTRLAIYLLTLNAVIFRSEVALLLSSHCLFMLGKAATNQARANLIRVVFIPAALSGGIAGLILTVAVDTYFWQSKILLWPELTAFLSNVFPQNDCKGASAWGTSPWHWYFTSALPRLLMNPITLPLVSPALADEAKRTAASELLIPCLGYVALYSILPHKETRFLFPIVPPITTVAALAIAHLQNLRPRPSTFAKASYYIIILSTAVTFFTSHFLLLPLSALSYPGAIALNKLHQYADHPNSPTRHQRQIHVHLDNLALQTGITRFLQHPPPDSPVLYFPASTSTGPSHTNTSSASRDQSTLWMYDKSENATEKLTPAFWQRFDYVIAERPELVVGAWEIVSTVYALDPNVLRVVRPGQPRQRRSIDHAGTTDEPGQHVKTANKTSEKEQKNRTVADPIHAQGYGYGPAEYLLQVWDVAGDILRADSEDANWSISVMGKHSLTRGWWIEPTMVERLYILQRTESGVGTM